MTSEAGKTLDALNAESELLDAAREPSEQSLIRAEVVLKNFDKDVITIYQLGQRAKARAHIGREIDAFAAQAVAAERNRAWCIAAARREGDQEVGAGAVAALPAALTERAKPAAAVAASDLTWFREIWQRYLDCRIIGKEFAQEAEEGIAAALAEARQAGFDDGFAAARANPEYVSGAAYRTNRSVKE